MADQTPTPAASLELATAALDFEHPLPSGDARYVDLGPGRGDKTRELIGRRLRRKKKGTHQHIVFASHRGAGKSTELLHLKGELEDLYRILYLEANVEMDPNRIEMEDLLLVLVQQVEAKMRAWGHPLPDALLKRVTDWFAEVIETTEVGKTYAAESKSEASAGATIPLLASLTTKLTALFRLESQHRTQVKEKLRQYPGSLMAAVNALLEDARRLLKETEHKELLIIIDNLDRYAPDVIDNLLILQGDRFRSLKCDMVLTPPISLLYRPERGKLDNNFCVEVMCSLRLRDKEDGYGVVGDPGAELLVEALRRRIDVDRLIPEASVRARLLAASGGSIRELLELVSDATLYAEGEVITEADAEQVIRRKRSRMRDKINANGWQKTLSQIARTKQINEDEACLSVLYQRLAFKFNSEFWYDIHPLVAEIPEVAALMAEPQ